MTFMKKLVERINGFGGIHMKPVKEFKEGLVKAAIFERTVQGQNGSFKSQSVALQKSYQKEGQWNNQSITLFPKDLPRFVKVLTDVAKHLGVKIEDA